ncbi:hypothetical protein [Ruegeria sp. Ofav3-42]|uniref:hypothetical protein n=1 Tax=Ruegeria sp. Ofav3-42 TaxID=2917759 RepID=UPI001EF60668|nr:hypothetical protein [Ruegeria sp. Ofav3-42]MCG7520716.1 hypothetical protein [Ruegeria sp. Ofav3-42]
MIWKTTTHEFSATMCQKTGKNCPALARMARAIAEAMATASPVTTSEFEMDGSSELTHCGEGCTALFRASPSRIRVYCGANTNDSADKLDDYADMMFGSGIASLPTGVLTTLPCAMLQASALAPRPSQQFVQQATT